MSTGWQCNRVCHLCTGDQWHDPRDSASWHTGGPGETPYKAGAPSPFLDLPGSNLPKHVQLDYCHCFHLGYGVDMAASTIVLLARMHFFGNARALDNNLNAAYHRFSSWCAQNHRVTSITMFSKMDFDMVLNLPLVQTAPFDY